MNKEDNSLSMLKIIREAIKQDPTFKYMWGIIAISAITSFIFQIIGNSKASIIGISLTIIGAAIVSMVSKGLNKEKTGYISIFILWGFAIFIISFLGFTVSAFAFSKPCNWVLFLNIPTEDCNMSKLQDNEEKPINHNKNALDCSEPFTKDTPFKCLELREQNK
jgi:hypothetical protein